MCGYLCTGCGRCKGKMRGSRSFGLCFSCGHENAPGATACSQCGAMLVTPPGSASSSANDFAVIKTMKKNTLSSDIAE